MSGSEGAEMRRNARTMGAVTIISRILGLAREMIAARAFGSGSVLAAFTFAFMVPNLFRKLLGEGAISSAFIPLYAKAVARDDGKASEFALASVNMLCGLLLALTVVGEIVLAGFYFFFFENPTYRLGALLSMVMLPYALLVCGTAFLAAILQVHRRFAAFAFTSVVLNLVLIIAMVWATWRLDLHTEAGRRTGVWWQSIAVLIAGILQIAILVPSLRAVGFRFRLVWHALTPEVKQLLVVTGPVALSAGVLQLGTALDKGLAFFLASTPGHETFLFFGNVIRYPMTDGAAPRLNWAQYLYQLPLGIFAISVATALFPRLSGGLFERRTFTQTLRDGIDASLFTALPATAGLMIAAGPIVRLLFQGGNFHDIDGILTARSTIVYASAIWAFALLQIVNRGFYALHDTVTPFRWSLYNLVINLAVELPLIFTKLGETGMAVGTTVSFMIQAVWMTHLLSKRMGGAGLELQLIWPRLMKMVLATLVMSVACLAVMWSPIYPAETGGGKRIWAIQTFELMGVGAMVYFGVCHLLGIRVTAPLRRGKKANV